MAEIGQARNTNELHILNFQDLEIIINFFFSLNRDDLAILIKYYSKALAVVLYQRMQNETAVRSNNNYLQLIEEDIARLESRWALPLSAIREIFEKAEEREDIEGNLNEQKSTETANRQTIKDVSITDRERDLTKEKNTILIKKWINESAVIRLRGLGFQPYQNALGRLNNFRRKRTKFKYLQKYFWDLGNSTRILKNNLKIMITLMELILNIKDSAHSIQQQVKKLGDNAKAIQNTVNQASRGPGAQSIGFGALFKATMDKMADVTVDKFNIFDVQGSLVPIILSLMESGDPETIIKNLRSFKVDRFVSEQFTKN